MQNVIGSVPRVQGRGFLSWVLRIFARTEARAPRPAFRWPDFRPVELPREDTSLTQAELEILR